MVVKLLKQAKERIKNITSKKENKDKFLRIEIIGGGCNGFQYKFFLDDVVNDSDVKIFDGDKLLCAIDDKSISMIDGSELDFVDELGGSYFKLNNPKASSKCGCGSSFNV